MTQLSTKMLTYSSSYSRYTIPAGTYKGQDEDINTIGVKSVLITSDSISEALVKQLTQMLFKKSKDSSIQHPWIFRLMKNLPLTTLQFLFIQVQNPTIKKKELI